MGFDELLADAQRRMVAVEALAAIVAKLRTEREGLAPHPEVRAAFDAVARAAGFDDATLAALAPVQREILLGTIRTSLKLASDLAERPERPPAWEHDDPAILESQGRVSMALAPIIRQIAPSLGDLAERLARPGGAFLDVGTGVGWLAVALAQAFPALRVVGIDVYEPSLELARRNTASFGDRIEVRRQDVLSLPDAAEFDAVFLPGPFLPRAAVPSAARRARAALRPGGWVLFGLFAPIDDPLSSTLTDLRILRSGGHPWRAGEVVALLDEAGFRSTRAFDRAWSMAMTFVAGQA